MKNIMSVCCSMLLVALLSGQIVRAAEEKPSGYISWLFNAGISVGKSVVEKASSLAAGTAEALQAALGEAQKQVARLGGAYEALKEQTSKLYEWLLSYYNLAKRMGSNVQDIQKAIEPFRAEPSFKNKAHLVGPVIQELKKNTRDVVIMLKGIENVIGYAHQWSDYLGLNKSESEKVLKKYSQMIGLFDIYSVLTTDFINKSVPDFLKFIGELEEIAK